MRQLPTYLRLLICSLLIGGYGAMYAGSIVHDLGHSVEAGKHARLHQDSAQSISDREDAQHLEVSCFFCTHAPVISTETAVEQIWTPAVASLAPPVWCASSLHSISIPLPELRGPPTV